MSDSKDWLSAWKNIHSSARSRFRLEVYIIVHVGLVSILLRHFICNITHSNRIQLPACIAEFRQQGDSGDWASRVLSDPISYLKNACDAPWRRCESAQNAHILPCMLCFFAAPRLALNPDPLF
jgi:hypothetical protein